LHLAVLAYTLIKTLSLETTMSRIVIIAALAASYFVYAILLNSVGTVILQSINSFGISKVEASTLEGFKDLSIAFVSFFVAAFIPRVGYKIAMLVGLASVSLVCLLTPTIASFWFIKLLFATIGASFALVKVSVYSLIGLLSDSTRAHSSLLNTVEGIFMFGSLSGYWLFSFYLGDDNTATIDWLNVYYPLAGIILLSLLLVWFSPIKSEQQPKTSNSLTQEFLQMLKMSYQPLVLVFVLSIFLYVLIEQGIGTWLPTFNSEVLKLPVDVSVQMTSIFAASLAIGRLLAGQILRFVNWYVFLNVAVSLMALLIMLTLPLTEEIDLSSVNSVMSAPLAAYLLPAIGLVMAPIYPVLNSVMLMSLPKVQHASMTGLIVVFSALGGTTGSIITGFIFEHFGGQQAFYMSLVPMFVILVSLFFFNRMTTSSPDRPQAEQPVAQ